MTKPPQSEGTITGIRRRFSQLFWPLWQKLPISAQARQAALSFMFRNFGFFFSWAASYRNWKTETERHAAQLARIAEFRERSGASPDRPGRCYVELSALPRPRNLLARAIAFYLPQFHPIPENNEWWGNGFTEWTNVRRARPQYQGHRQPRRPAELGYYDLMLQPHIRRRQAQLAEQYGLEGFCFYFYWFNGKRLLDGPVEEWANDDEVTFPFCLCWANESWSRRWDGREDKKLISQDHSSTDDIAFISHISRYLKLEKYIRVDGRPLVIIYRPDLFPDPAATASRLRTWCRENGVGEIYLAYTLSFVNGTPQEYGYDAAIEFPPNNMGLEPQTELVCPLGEQFEARIYDLTKLASRPNDTPSPGYKLFRGVTPQWDNTARRMNKSAIMLDGGPELYGSWLRHAAIDTAQRFRNKGERLVFINAWNEWAEGAYLEPDQDDGYGWLAATRNALTAEPQEAIEPADLVPAEPAIDVRERLKVLLVIHDLHLNGAQIHSLYMAACLRQIYGYDVTIIACGDGPLGANFASYGTLIRLPRNHTSSKDARNAIGRLHRQGYTYALINSSASGWITPYLSEFGIACIGLVHEMPDIIRKMQIEEDVSAFDAHASAVVFASEIIRQRTETDILGHAWKAAHILPQGHYKAESVLHLSEKQIAATEIRNRFDLPEDAVLIIGVGHGDHRKGIDIFCEWAVSAASKDPRRHFIWIGSIHPDMREICEGMLSRSGAVSANVHFAGFQTDTSSFYRAASAYALPSREDPYPTTVLEALACGTPAIVVRGRTGLDTASPTPAIRFLHDDKADTFTDNLNDLLESRRNWEHAATAGVRLVQEDYGFTSFIGDLLRLAGAFQPRISVIVPNYNYARYLPHRIATILNQEMPVWEIIFLDDASTDDSVETAEMLLKDCGIHYRIIPNAENSGSVFAQWQKGVDLARGDIVWIAEADDWAAASFTRVAARAFEDEDVVISYTQSNQVSEASEILCPHYLDYVADLDRERWRRHFVNDGMAELNDGFSIKNSIPNVSGALFRRDALAAVLGAHMDEIRSYRVAGDWCAYAHLAQHGKVAFDPRPLNYHRRHEASVTISRFTEAEWNEIARMQARIAELGNVSPENADKARAYLEVLRKKLLA